MTFELALCFAALACWCCGAWLKSEELAWLGTGLMVALFVLLVMR